MRKNLIMDAELMKINEELSDLEQKMLRETEKKAMLVHQIHGNHQEAAKNLIKYLVLRSKDRRQLQERLHIHGLSSMTSSEGHIHRQVQAVRERLGHSYPLDELSSNSFDTSKLKLEENCIGLFGPRTTANCPSIMVTFDTDFASNYQLVEDLLKNGMNVARINCAHHDESIWSEMVQQIKKASNSTGFDCKIYMDLAGPKIRTKLLGKGIKKGSVKVKPGQLIWLAEAREDENDKEIIISPTEPGIIKQIKIGDRVFIDDGMIRCTVECQDSKKVGIRIDKVFSKKRKIKAEKGINFPDSDMDIPSLTDFDINCLPFVCKNADMVGFSFVKKPSDINDLREKFEKLDCVNLPIILKIETPESVENFPALLMEGMKGPHMGVMIARGDLAVEIGFERMGEIQEEILWICEAAHVPVIWATQVLENLQKSGMPTRAEITDAGLASQAECIMINKGKHTIEVMKSLKDIIHRAASHRIKKRFTFRPLSIASDFLDTPIG
ncbi:MAG: pyruvate kinase [Cyclobacteriaceae bacterium]